MKETMIATSTLVVEICCACGTAFAMEETLYRNLLRRKGETFFCPNGHPQSYTGEPIEKKYEKIKRALENETTSREWWQEEAEKKARSLSATKGQLTKTKNRIAKGVCPCCNRQFINLQRHMETKHPEYIDD